MQIVVQHLNQDRETGDVLGFENVARVTVPDEITDVQDALEYAYRWTNNIHGSWSIKQRFLDYPTGGRVANGDYNTRVTVLRPLHEGGYGLRSTSMFDRLVVKDDGTYRVAMVGFERIDDE